MLPSKPIEGRVRVDLCVVAPIGFPGSLGDVQGIAMPIVKQRAFVSPPATDPCRYPVQLKGT